MSATLTLNSLELKMLKLSLEQLSDEQSCAGSNDFVIPDGLFTDEELKQLSTDIAEMNEVEPETLNSGSYIFDFDLTNLLQGKVSAALAEE